MLEGYYNKGKAVETVLFRSEGFVKDWSVPSCSGRRGLPMSSIPPFLRTLLVTDGTVTKSLEAYFWESVNIKTIEQGLCNAESNLPWLDVSKGEEVLTREVELRGSSTNRIYATAFSTIRPQAIPNYCREKLLKGEIGIGKLIRESGLESYREILEIGLDPEKNTDDSDGGIDLIHRTYCVYLSGKPALLITERFPLNVYT